MNSQGHLWGWIFGTLAAAGVAVAGSRPPSAAPAPPAAQAQNSKGALAQGGLDQSGQIWECTTHGVKTFSNNPCGNKSIRVALRPINTMTPTPVFRSARAYRSEPRYTKEYADQNLYSDQDSSAQGSDGYAYPVDQGYQGYIYAPLFRPDHHRRPEHHHDASSEPHRFPAQRPASVHRRP